MKKAKKNIVLAFCIFMMLMVVLGLVSRGIYGMKLARVETGYAVMSPIKHTVTGSGTVVGGMAHPIYLPEGLLVEKMHVTAGASVKKGETLLTLDLEDLQEKLNEAEKQLAIEETLLSDIRFNRKQADADAAKAWERAQTDLSQVTEEQNTLLSKAKQDYETAEQTLNAYPSFETYFEEIKKEDDEYKKLLKASKDKKKSKGERKAAKKELSAYEETLAKSAKENWESKRQELEFILETSREAYLSAESNQKKEVQTAERALEDAGKKTKDEAGMLLQQNAVEDAKEVVMKYQALIDAEGKMISEYDGVVESASLKAGDRTNDSAAFVIIDAGDGWQFLGKVGRDDRKYLRVGESIRLKFPNFGSNDVDAKILSVSVQMDEMEMYEFHAKLLEGDYSYGEMGSLTIEKQNEGANCHVPLTALYAGSDGTYVLVLQEENTFLGTQLRAVKRRVEVVDKNDIYAELKESSLGADEEIIISSDRAVAPNDIVRKEEP